MADLHEQAAHDKLSGHTLCYSCDSAKIPPNRKTSCLLYSYPPNAERPKPSYLIPSLHL